MSASFEVGVSVRTSVAATRAGEAAARALGREGHGYVVSVHRRAVNVLLDDRLVIGLLPPGRPLHPWAVTVPIAPAEFVPGAPVGVEDCALTVASVRIELGRMERVDLRLEVAASPLGDPTVLSDLSPPLPGDDPFAPALDRAIAGLWTDHGVAGLIGLGAGLTPSGDDVVMGVLAGLELSSRESPPASWLRRCLVQSIPPDLPRRTTRLSAQLLRAAAEGEYAEPIVHLCRALCRGDRPARVRARDDLLEMGHRSGREALWGFCEALGWVGRQGAG